MVRGEGEEAFGAAALRGLNLCEDLLGQGWPVSSEVVGSESARPGGQLVVGLSEVVEALLDGVVDLVLDELFGLLIGGVGEVLEGGEYGVGDVYDEFHWRLLWHVG